MDSVQPPFTIIDAHQHLWDPNRFSYSWMHALPALNCRHLVEEYDSAAKGTDVTGTVYVDTDVDDADLAAETEWILSLAVDSRRWIDGVVAGMRPERVDFRESLERVVAHPKLKGVRRVLHTQPDATSQQADFVENIRFLAECNLSFDVCVNWRQLPVAIELVRKCPDVSFVLDHCGGPDVKAQRLDPWRENIRVIAHEPNLVCKISGLVASADPLAWTIRDLEPFVAHVIECFGWERVLWGSDWPVCTLTSSFGRWLKVARSLVSGATPEQQALFFSGNARKVYRLAPDRIVGVD